MNSDCVGRAIVKKNYDACALVLSTQVVLFAKRVSSGSCRLARNIKV